MITRTQFPLHQLRSISAEKPVKLFEGFNRGGLLGGFHLKAKNSYGMCERTESEGAWSFREWRLGPSSTPPATPSLPVCSPAPPFCFCLVLLFLIFIRNNHNTRGLTLGAIDPHSHLVATWLVYVMVAVPTIRNSPHTQHPDPGAKLHDPTCRAWLRITRHSWIGNDNIRITLLLILNRQIMLCLGYRPEICGYRVIPGNRGALRGDQSPQIT